jgi:hypothetical protein
LTPASRLGTVVVGATVVEVVDVVAGRVELVDGAVVGVDGPVEGGAVVVVGGVTDAAATAPANAMGAANATATIDLHLTSQRG